jgi:hypothetical protein
MRVANDRGKSGNLLIRSIPADIYRALEIAEEEHPSRVVLIGPEETPSAVFFPHAGAVASIVRSTSTGQMVEAGVVGSEGLFNVHSILAKPGPTGTQAIVHGAGTFSRVPISKLQLVFRDNAGFRDAALAYVSMFLDQVTQNLVCNRLHDIERRLAKWLLLIRDRIPSDHLHITQEFLSYMLGVHRPGVSIAVSTLENEALISHRRNWIEILDREGVMARSCECYEPLHEKLSQFRSGM